MFESWLVAWRYKVAHTDPNYFLLKDSIDVRGFISGSICNIYAYNHRLEKTVNEDFWGLWNLDLYHQVCISVCYNIEILHYTFGKVVIIINKWKGVTKWFWCCAYVRVCILLGVDPGMCIVQSVANKRVPFKSFYLLSLSEDTRIWNETNW